LYLAVVTKLTHYYSEPVHDNQCGFSAGRQEGEIFKLCRMAIHKATLWNIPLYTCKLDVDRAFDVMRHSLILDSLLAAKCPAKLCVALMRDLSQNSMTLLFQGECWPNIPYTRGGKQGGSETPELWKRVLNNAMIEIVGQWHEKKMGAHIGEISLQYMAWADDLVFFNHSAQGLNDMCEILCASFSKALYQAWLNGNDQNHWREAPSCFYMALW
jgi:hypothetical protein